MQMTITVTIIHLCLLKRLLVSHSEYYTHTMVLHTVPVKMFGGVLRWHFQFFCGITLLLCVEVEWKLH